MTLHPIDIQLRPASIPTSLPERHPVNLRHANLRCCSLNELPRETEEFWLRMHRQDPRFDSPYYHPEFVRAVAAVRDDVEIAVFENESNQTVAVFPLQRISEHVADPIGGRMNDYHGLIAAQDTIIDIPNIMDRLNLQRFRFHALSQNFPGFDSYTFEKLPSYFVDIGDGFDEYQHWLNRHSSTIKRLPQKIRSLARNVGPVKFEFETFNANVVEQMIELKRKKYQKTKTFDILSVDWAANLLREIAKMNGEKFRGITSALWAGEKLIAAHVGMISDHILHYWFPSFDPHFNKYSPGLQLMLNTIKSAAKADIKRIDMSYGQSEFKDKFCNGSNYVNFGVVDNNRLRFEFLNARYQVRKKLKEIPFKQPVKTALRMVFPNFGGWNFK
ncbi:MAG: GNAT family N-acetyltransferase [Planctomycetota bacterium]